MLFDGDVSEYSSEDLDNMPVYDVADMLKLYFHELPDCLLTERLSETCCSIFTRKTFAIYVVIYKLLGTVLAFYCAMLVGL